MTDHYAYTPYVWPMLASPALLLVLGAYAWRHRSAPGARPFVALVLSIVPWAIGAAFELAAVDPATKIRWYMFQGVWQLPAATAALWFALEYADLGRLLSRRTAAVLAVPAAVALVLMPSSSSHDLLCSAFTHQGDVRCVVAPTGWILLGYGFALALASSLVFLWLFVRSPLHRWPAALCLSGHLASRVGYLFDSVWENPVAPMHAVILGSTFTAAMYAVALFGFRMFELVPVARWTLIEQMREGVLVLDSAQRIADLNPAAERILGIPGERARARAASDLIPFLPDLARRPGEPDAVPPEITLGPAGAGRQYALELSALQHRGGFRLGYLVILHDVTEQRHAQARTVENERALATLRERDRVARELHDSLGQVLGYAKMQAQAARGLLARQEWRQADEHLAQLVAVAQDAHADVREYILGARAAGASEAEFLPSLEDYLHRFRSAYGIDATLETPTELAGRALEPMVGAQLIRIIQETLTNVRKHARARAVRVSLSLEEGKARAVVQDDGQGFDPAQLAAAEANTFGLRFMRERADEVGGTVEVRPVPGRGTRVVITVPLQGRVP
jgi:signal transduction histidine kinase